MIVQASAALLLVLVALSGVIVVRCIYFGSDNDNHKIIAQRFIMIIVIFSLIVTLFSFAWIITGSVWIFGAKTNGVQGSNSAITTTYCQSDLYRAAFVLIIINYIVHILIILLIIVRCVCFKRENIAPPHDVSRDRV
jgi:hypothetical protein